MRVHELSEEFDDVSTDQVLDVLKDDLGVDVDHHMNKLDDDTVRRARIIIREETILTSSLPEPSTLKQLYGNVVDSVSFSIGLGLLLVSDRGDETRSRIREEITDLGRQITDPVKIGGEEIIDLLEVVPSQIGRATGRALDMGSKFSNIRPDLQGVMNGAVEFVNRSQLPGTSTNGDARSKTQEQTN